MLLVISYLLLEKRGMPIQSISDKTSCAFRVTGYVVRGTDCVIWVARCGPFDFGFLIRIRTSFYDEVSLVDLARPRNRKAQIREASLETV